MHVHYTVKVSQAMGGGWFGKITSNDIGVSADKETSFDVVNSILGQLKSLHTKEVQIHLHVVYQ